MVITNEEKCGLKLAPEKIDGVKVTPPHVNFYRKTQDEFIASFCMAMKLAYKVGNFLGETSSYKRIKLYCHENYIYILLYNAINICRITSYALRDITVQSGIFMTKLSLALWPDACPGGRVSEEVKDVLLKILTDITVTE